MIISRPIHSAYCDLCMKPAEIEADSLTVLFKMLEAKGWKIEDAASYCKDKTVCGECKG